MPLFRSLRASRRLDFYPRRRASRLPLVRRRRLNKALKVRDIGANLFRSFRASRHFDFYSKVSARRVRPWLDALLNRALKVRNIGANLFRSFRASRHFDFCSRGDALRACPWLSYSAPSALESGIPPRCVRNSLALGFGTFRRWSLEFLRAAFGIPWRWVSDFFGAGVRDSSAASEYGVSRQTSLCLLWLTAPVGFDAFRE